MNQIQRDLRLFADGQEIGQGCRMVLQSRETLSLNLCLFLLDILDLSDSSEARLSSAKSVEVRSFSSVLGSGEVMNVHTFGEKDRRVTTVVFSPLSGVWKKTVSLSLPAGMLVSDAMREVLKAGGTEVSLAAFQADDSRVSRPQSFFGRVCDVLADLAAAADAYVFLTPAGVCVQDRRPVPPTLTIPRSVLLSAPDRMEGGAILNTSVMGWPMGACVRYEWKGTVRTGRLVSKLIDADNVTGPWKTELELEWPEA